MYPKKNFFAFRCLCLGAVLHVPLARGRPDVLESPAAALTVCLVQTERSATTLVFDMFENLKQMNDDKVTDEKCKI